MSASAVHLEERVLPAAPIRHWICSLLGAFALCSAATQSCAPRSCEPSWASSAIRCAHRSRRRNSENGRSAPPQRSCPRARFGWRLRGRARARPARLSCRWPAEPRSCGGTWSPASRSAWRQFSGPKAVRSSPCTTPTRHSSSSTSPGLPPATPSPRVASRSVSRVLGNRHCGCSSHRSRVPRRRARTTPTRWPRSGGSICTLASRSMAPIAGSSSGSAATSPALHLRRTGSSAAPTASS
jgi:hypothetical protein